ncbi:MULTISPECIES: efflux RND transporter periplasmic adaptor subunit [Pseudomonas]|uniref:efflux RND transporter periplasmic adaptor subunit n=1 Tax=Pseudomonas TaxID=286 RepID=UPI001596A6E3|nr:MULTISPECIES: HlyD family efflux transporter periplasmic adaptor subunit [Pseudomonas]
MIKWGFWLAVAITGGVLAMLNWPSAVQPREQRWLRVEPQSLENRLGLVGRLQAARQVTLSAPFAGVVAAMPVEEGQRVEAGQPLISLDTAQLDIQLRRAQAERLKAQDQLLQLRSWQGGPQVARGLRAVGAARAAMAATQASLDDTQRLFERGIVARMEVASLEQLLGAQRQALLDAEQELRLTRARGQGDALLIAEMELANAQARWQILTRMREQQVIEAPFAGVLLPVSTEAGRGGRQLHVGQAVSQGMALLTLVDLERLQVMARLEEHDLVKVREGMEVEAVIAGQRLAGRIDRIAMQARDDTAQGAWYDVRVDLDLPAAPLQLGLRLGMSAQLQLLLHRQERAMVVPAPALQVDEAGRTYVLFRADETQAPRKVPVTAGPAGVQGVEVQGLESGYVLIAPEPPDGSDLDHSAG